MPKVVFDVFITRNITKSIGKPGQKMLKHMNVPGDITAKPLYPDYEVEMEKDSEWTEDMIEDAKKYIESELKSSGIFPKYCEFRIEKRSDPPN